MLKSKSLIYEINYDTSFKFIHRALLLNVSILSKYIKLINLTISL